jgi:hypothetical protein
MENENRNRQHSSPRSLGGILELSHSLENLGSTSRESKGSSLTTTSPKANHALIGKPLSEHGLTTLRNIAASVLQGNPLDDKELETLLVQHFTSSRFVVKQIVKHIYHDGGQYECVNDGYEISLDVLHDSEMKLYDALKFLNKPAKPEFVAKYVARLGTVMARRSESNQDIAVLIDTYTEHLENYPPDVIKSVCDMIINKQKWFPLVCEIRKEAYDIVSFRKSVLKCFEKCRNPLIKHTKPKQIEADPHLKTHWKMLSRDKWLKQHYDWWIEDAEDMLNIAKQNPTMFNVDEWEEEASRRMAGRPA